VRTGLSSRSVIADFCYPQERHHRLCHANSKSLRFFQMPLSNSSAILSLLPTVAAVCFWDWLRVRPLPKQQFDTVYVSARQVYLHDRVGRSFIARGEVVNGQSLQVLEHSKRFLKVRRRRTRSAGLKSVR